MEERYHDRIDPECIMALRHAPHLVSGQAAVDAVTGTPEWDKVALSDRVISRPQEGLIVVGYTVHAEKGGTEFVAACTSVYRRKAREETVVQHAQVALKANC